MKINDILKYTNDDFDTCDTVYDVEVTVCYNESNEDWYDRFCNYIYDNVDVRYYDRVTHYMECEYSEFVKSKYEKLQLFMKRHWTRQYDDEDDFIYEWIKEINYYLAGYVSENVYELFMEVVGNE